MTTTRSGLRLQSDRPEGQPIASSSSAESDLNSSRASVGSMNDSFTRQSRVEEKEQLHTLNQRLRDYILKKRNDDSQLHLLNSKLEKAKVAHAKSLQTVRKEMQGEIDEVIAEREFLLAEIAKLRQALSDVDQVKLQHAEEMKEVAVRTESLETENKSLTKKLEEVTVVKERLLSERRAIEANLKEATASRNRLDKDVDRLRSKVEAAEREAYNTRHAAYTATTDLERVRAQLDAAQKQLETEREAHQHALDEEREKYEADFAENLKASARQADASHQKVLDELREAYDLKLTSIRREVAASQTALDAARAAEAEAVEANEEATAAKEELTRQMAILRVEATKLREEASKLRKAPQKKLQALRDQITEYRAELHAKQGEIDSLYDTKITLSKELETYERLMDDEDRRLESRPKKRRRQTVPAGAPGGAPADARSGRAKRSKAATNPNAPAAMEDVQESKEEPQPKAAPQAPVVASSPATPVTANGKPILYISDIDSTTSALEIRSGFSREDPAKRGVPLDGWSLRTVKEPSEEIYFPDGCVVAPGKPFLLVQTFDEAYENERGIPREHIVELDSEAMNGRDLTKLDFDDALVLVNPREVTVHQVLVGDFQRRKSCLIM